MAVGGNIEIKITLEGIENALKGLETLGESMKKQAGKSKDLVKDLGDAQKSFKNIGDGFKTIGTNMTKYVTLPIIGGFSAMGKMFADFEYSVEKAGTLLSDTYDREIFKGEIIELSRDTGIDATQLGESIYTALSSAVPEEHVIEFTLQAHKLATAGFTDEATATDILTTAINAYQMEATDAARISDILVAAQDKGKTTVGELGHHMGRLIPIASQNGVSLEEVAAAMAMLTKNGISTAEASTYLRSMMNQLGRSGSRADETLRELTGKGFKGLMEEGYNVSDVLQILKKHTDEEGLSLQDLFGNIRGGSGAMSLMIGEGEELTNLIDVMEGSTGRADTNFAKMSDTMSYRMRKAFTGIKTSALEVAMELTPVWEKVAEVMSNVADKTEELAKWFSELSEQQQLSLVKWAGFIAILGPLALVLSGVFKFLSLVAGGLKGIIWLFSAGENGVTGFSKILGHFGSIWKGVLTVFKWVSGFMLTGIAKIGLALKGLFAAFLAHPFVFIAVIVIAVVAAIIQNWETLGPFFAKVWEKVKEIFWNALQAIGEYFAEKLTEFKQDWETGWTAITEFFSGIWDSMVSGLQATWDFIVNIFTVAVLVIWEIIKTVNTLVALPFLFVWENVKDGVFAVWETIKNYFSDALTWISGVFDLVLPIIKAYWEQTWNSVKEKAAKIWNAIANFFVSIWKSLLNGATLLWTAVKDFFVGIWEKIGDDVKRAWNGIKEFLVRLWNIIKDSVMTIVRAFADVMKRVWENLVAATMSIYGKFKEVFLRFWENLRTAVIQSLGRMKEKILGVWDSVKATTERVWNNIKDKILSPVEDARKKIKEQVDKIKKIFDFKWSFPKLKLPHFSIQGKFSLNPPSAPSLGVDWYATGGIATGPSVVGIGEAGDEAIVPLSNKKRMRPFAQAVASMIGVDETGVGGGSGGGVLITGNNFTVREEADIRKVSQELYKLIERDRKGGGRR